jgi:tetratricopeptide (TPR) repeat protein
MRGAIFTLVLGTIAGAAWGQDLQGDALRASAAALPSAAVTPPRPVLTLEMRGDIYMARKQFRDAIDIFHECPESAVIENKIGIGYHQLYELKLAKKSYQKAIKLNSKYAEAVNNLGTVYYAERSFRKSIKYYKRALKLQPASASIWANLGSAYFAKHDFKHAAKAYDQALTLDPMVFDHHSQYGTLLQERTLEDRAKFHMYLAKAFAQRGDKEKAVLYLRKALEEGIKDRSKIPEIPEFASLKTDSAFQQLLLENPKPL